MPAVDVRRNDVGIGVTLEFDKGRLDLRELASGIAVASVEHHAALHHDRVLQTVFPDALGKLVEFIGR